MKKSDQLKQQRASKMEEISGILEARGEDGNLNEEQRTQFDTLEAEIKTLDDDISRAEREEAIELRAAEMAGASGQSNIDPEEIEKGQINARASLFTAINNIRSGKPLEGAEKEMHEIGLQENRDAGVQTPDNAQLQVPLSALRATAQTVSEDSGNYGGELVVDQAPRVQMGFTPSSILDRLGITYLEGLTGGDIPLPVVGNYSFAWLAETGAITPQKQTITGPKLSPNRLGGAVEISNRLLAQSSPDVEALIRGRLAKGYEDKITVAAINGSGTAPEPEGLLNNSSVQTGASTDADIPTKALVAELVKLVLEADSTMDRLAFLGSPATQYLLSTTIVDSGSGKYLKEMADNLLGYTDYYSTHVPQLSSNEVLIFGDWSQLFVGTWGSLSVLSDPYSKSLENSIRLVLNGHADVAIAQPTAFAVNKYFNDTDA